MICDSCGTHIDAFGDDGVDTSVGFVPIAVKKKPHIINRYDDGVVIKIKAMCPSCGHIQYGCRVKSDINGGD
jgi:hypothetical protein